MDGREAAKSFRITPRARSSVGKSVCLLSRGSGVRIPPGAPLFCLVFSICSGDILPPVSNPTVTTSNHHFDLYSTCPVTAFIRTYEEKNKHPSWIAQE